MRASGWLGAGSRVEASFGVVALFWALFEVAAAAVLRDRFSLGDWAALAAKLSFLAPAALRGVRCAVAGGSLAAASVRLANGWLAYTWFTVAAPLFSIAAIVVLRWKGRVLGGYTTVASIHLAVALLMGATLAGMLYQAPRSPPVEGFVALPLGYAALALLRPLPAACTPLLISPALTLASWLAA